MASIFKTLDDLVTNVSEKINKDKWDRNALNPALLEAANEAEEKAKEEERLKHFQNQLENRVPLAAGAETVGNINTVVCAEAPVSTAPASDPNTTYAGFSDMEMLLTPPDLPVKPVKFVKSETPKEEPVAKGPVAIAPVPTIPVKEKPSVKEKDETYIKPVFKSRFSGPKKQTDPETTPETTPTVEAAPTVEATPVAETTPTYGAHPTIPLSDLPVIDPSQSLSAMMKKEEQLEAQPLTTTILAHTSAVSEEQSVEKQIEEQVEETPSVPVYTAPEEPAEAAPAEVTSEPVPAGLQGLYGTVPETVEERIAEQQLHEDTIEKEVTIEPAVQKPVEKPEETTVKTEVVKTEAASPAEDKKNPCYYILIKHTKTYPEKGSLVMMRSCDHEYAWTNKQDESEKPTYDICPGCGMPISYTSTEID